MRRKTLGELIAMKKQVLDKMIYREINRNQAAGLLSMHPNAVSRLKKEYQERGEEALTPKPPGPKKGSSVYNKTPDWIEDLVIKIEKSNYSSGPKDLADKLFDEYGVRIDQTTVYRILKRKKIRYYYEYKRWKKDEEPKSYCLDTPGLELQLDACYPFGRSRKIAGFDVIDDCSRWTYGKLYERENAENGINFINHLIRVAPFRIQRIRVDNRYGKVFKKYCEFIGIEVIVNDPYMPKQNGKVERFHKTVKREFFWKYCSFHDSMEVMQYKYNGWQDHYNRKRRHGGYGMNRMTPYQKIASTLFLSLNNINYPQNVTLTLQPYNGSGLFHILLCEIANPTSQFPAFEIDGLISYTSRKLIRELASGHNCVATIIPNFKEKKDVDIKDAVDIFKNTSLILEEISKYAKDKKIGFSIFKISHFENIIQVI